MYFYTNIFLNMWWWKMNIFIAFVSFSVLLCSPPVSLLPLTFHFGLNFWTMRKIALNNITFIYLTDSIHIVGHSSVCNLWSILLSFDIPVSLARPIHWVGCSLFHSYSLAYDEFFPKTFLSLDVFFSCSFWFALLLYFVVLVIYLWFLFHFAFIFEKKKKKENERKNTHQKCSYIITFIFHLFYVFLFFLLTMPFFIIIIHSLEFWPSAHSDHTHKNG